MDTKQKYVRIGKYEFIIFPTTINHDAFFNFHPTSAGFCYIYGNKVDCYGESVSLKLKSLPEDSMLATKQVFGYEAVLNINK